MNARSGFTDVDVAAATLEFIKDRPGQLLLHAGAVASPEGRVVVVHGESGAGKTTLTATLATYGFAYLSDETVCVDPSTLQIEAFRKPLTVKPGSQQALQHLLPAADRIDATSGNWQVEPDVLLQFGAIAPPDVPLLPAIIVFPNFDAQQVGVDVVPVRRARAAFVLGEQSSALWSIEPRPLAAVARVINAAPAYQVSYAEAFDAAPVIVHTMQEVEAAHAVPESVSDTKQPIPTATIGPRRADGVDWLFLDGEAVLFDGTQLHHLDVPGAAIWGALNGEDTLGDIAYELATNFGAEPDQVMLDVEDLVRVLRARNLVR